MLNLIIMCLEVSDKTWSCFMKLKWVLERKKKTARVNGPEIISVEIFV